MQLNVFTDHTNFDGLLNSPHTPRHIAPFAQGGLRCLKLQLLYEIFTQTSIFPLTTLTAASKFGSALTAGDFDGDGYADLAIGTPGMTVDGNTQAGGVYAIYGTATGLNNVGAQLITQNTAGILGDANKGAAFGQALVRGALQAPLGVPRRLAVAQQVERGVERHAPYLRIKILAAP